MLNLSFQPKPNHKTVVSLSSTDTELAQGLQAQDFAALETIYQRHNSLVYTLALKILNNPQEAEDLTQEIFLKLWRKQAYDPKRGSLPSYLATLTRSQAIDRLRVRSNRQKIVTRWQQILGPSPPSKTPMEQATWTERQTQIRQALDQLPDHYRTVLELSYFNGYSQSEIAKQLETPLGTVKTWARKGLLELRTHFQSFPNEQ